MLHILSLSSCRLNRVGSRTHLMRHNSNTKQNINIKCSPGQPSELEDWGRTVLELAWLDPVAVQPSEPALIVPVERAVSCAWSVCWSLAESLCCQRQIAWLDKVLEEVEEKFALEEVALEWEEQWLEGEEERLERQEEVKHSRGERGFVFLLISHNKLEPILVLRPNFNLPPVKLVWLYFSFSWILHNPSTSLFLPKWFVITWLFGRIILHLFRSIIVPAGVFRAYKSSFTSITGETKS